MGFSSSPPQPAAATAVNSTTEHNQPISMTRPYQIRGYQPGLCPISEELWREQIFRLPLNLGMTEQEIDLIVNAVGRTIDQLMKK